MTIRFSTGLRNQMLADAANSGNGLGEIFKDGVIYIQSGAQPASADAALTGTTLLIITVDGGAFTPGSPTNGLEFDPPTAGVMPKAAAENWQGVGIAAGVATWFRHMANGVDSFGSSTTLPRIDGPAGTFGTSLIMSTVNIAIGTPVTVDQYNVFFNASN